MKAPVSYTIRGIPNEVDAALRRKAKQAKKSLNRLIVDELTSAMVGREKKVDYSNLVGRWTNDPGFDEIIASQRQIDPEKWK